MPHSFLVWLMPINSNKLAHSIIRYANVPCQLTIQFVVCLFFFFVLFRGPRLSENTKNNRKKKTRNKNCTNILSKKLISKRWVLFSFQILFTCGFFFFGCWEFVLFLVIRPSVIIIPELISIYWLHNKRSIWMFSNIKSDFHSFGWNPWRDNERPMTDCMILVIRLNCFAQHI